MESMFPTCQDHVSLTVLLPRNNWWFWCQSATKILHCASGIIINTLTSITCHMDGYIHWFPLDWLFVCGWLGPDQQLMVEEPSSTLVRALYVRADQQHHAARIDRTAYTAPQHFTPTKSAASRQLSGPHAMLSSHQSPQLRCHTKKWCYPTTPLSTSTTVPRVWTNQSLPSQTSRVMKHNYFDIIILWHGNHLLN